MLIAKELQERNGYVSFEGDVVKAREFVEPSGVTAFGLEDEYPNTTNLTENTAFRILPDRQAVADEFIDSSIGVGDTVIVDGIEALIVYVADEEEEWGKYLAVDKNHDLCYYLEGSDFVDDDSYYNSEMYKWAFCWGEYDKDENKTGVNKTAIGTGLINTNTLLSLNLQQYYPERAIVWDKLQEFRSSHSDRWFIPSLRELEQVFIQQERLQNISKINYNYYWTSSEDGNRGSYARLIYVYKNTVNIGNFIRKNNIARTRACVYLSDSDFEKGKISVKKRYEPLKVGDTVIVDGIESCVIYKAETEQSWGQYIIADKNHDLCYYFEGKDYVDDGSYYDFPTGTFGYEWGGYETLVGVPSLDIGDGLSNTNSLIAMNLQPRTSKWKIVWDMVKHFRSDHSDKWFVPTYYEIREVYKQRSYLQNLTTDSSQHPYYWTSTEFNSSDDAYYADFSNGSIYSTFKFHNDRRTRLCRYLSNSEPLITRASYEVGKVYSIDFIDAMCVYDAGSEQSWGRYLFAEVEDSIQPLSNVNSYSGSETATDIGRGYLNWLILKYSNWKNALYNSIQAVTQYRETQWFLPSLNELKTGLQALGQWNDTFYLSSSEGALNLWGASIRGDDSDTLNRECHIKLFTTDKLINAEYKVGDYREINGIGTVCVLDRLTVDERRYLFADRHGLAYYLKGVEDDWDTSIDDTKASYAWGTDSSLTNLNRQIGYGYPNTESALATDLVNQDTVWKALRDVQVQRNDNRWFLPSLFELMPLYEQKKNIGSLPYGGQNAWLWSSSCANASTAYSLSFYDGAQGQNAKINPYHARAVYADRKIFFRIGDIVTIDGIESVIIYKRISDNGQNTYILVDRNHDLCYYSLGSDFVDDNDYTNGWGFEWGGTGILTGVSSTEFEAGFSNSNILIDMNLVPSASDWTTVWEALSDFRASHSSQWFLPSQEELELVYDVRELLNNLSCNTNFSYLSSSEDSENYVKTVGMNSGWIHTPLSKRSHLTRCRLCRMATDLDLMLSS